MSPRLRRIGSVTVVLALLGACTVGPDYARPPAVVSAGFKEAEGWKLAEPRDIDPKGEWWVVYGDPVLDGLMRQVDISNQNLAAAEAAYRQASAAVRGARATLFPTLGLNASAARSERGGSSGVSSFSSGGSRTANQFDVSASAGWELDVWGRIRRTVESNVAGAQASAGDLAAARLSAQGDLASAYFQLRVADQIKRLLDESASAYAESLRIARNQFAQGIVSRADVAQAETQVNTTRAQAINVGVARAQFEHAIAVLIGRPPADLTLGPAEQVTGVPVVPPGIPSALLERRPDIAAAERRMAAANAQIGVAEAAYYPTISLSGLLGFSASALGGLFTASNRLWSIGSDLAWTVFDAGGRTAAVDQARAFYDQNVASYRQTVLTAFQQVEDALSTLRILEEQAAAQEIALRSAREAERLALNQYRAGTVAYTTVIVAQTQALSNAQAALNIQQNRLTASVALIRALGGGWTAERLPSTAQAEAEPASARK